MQTKKHTPLLLIALVVLSIGARGQVTVTGPTCVIPGTVYQYLIKGTWDSTSTMQICLTGGTIAGSSVSCTTNGNPLSFVRVTWNASGPGSITITSSNGTGTLAVTIGSILGGGSIPAAVKTQSIAYKGTPSVITCAASTGGACNAVYQYQWQQSIDRLNWTDISGAQGVTLSLGQPLTQALFFRRRVTETNSGTIAYSEEAFVNVPAAPATAITH